MPKKLTINELELKIDIPNSLTWNDGLVEKLKKGIEDAFDHINSKNQIFKNDGIDFIEIDLGTLSSIDEFKDALTNELWVTFAPYFKILDSENSSPTLYDLFKSPKKNNQTQEIWSYLNSSFEFSDQNIDELIKNWERNSILSLSDIHELMIQLLGDELSGELISWYRKNFGETVDPNLLKLFIELFQRKRNNLSLNNIVLFESIFELWFKQDIYLLLFHSKNGPFEEKLLQIILSRLSDDEIMEINQQGFFQSIIKGNSLDYQNLTKVWQKRLIQTYSLQKVDGFLAETLPIQWTNTLGKKSYHELEFFLHLLAYLNISPNRKLYSIAIQAVLLGKPFNITEWIVHFFELVYPELPSEWRNSKRFEEQILMQLSMFREGKKSIRSVSEYWLWIKQSDTFMLLWNKSIPAALKRLTLISEYLYQSATVNPKYPWKKRLFPTTNLSPNISKDAPKVIEILIGDIKSWLNVTTPFSTTNYSDKEILHIHLVIGEIKSLLFDFETFLMVLSRYYNRSEGWWREWVFTSPIQKQYLFNIWRDTVLQIQKLEQVVTLEIAEREYLKNDELKLNQEEFDDFPNLKANASIELLYNQFEEFKKGLTEEEWSVLQKFIEDQNSDASKFKLKFKSIENALLIWFAYWKTTSQAEVPLKIQTVHRTFQSQWWKELLKTSQWINLILSSHHVTNSPQFEFLLKISKALSTLIQENIQPESISLDLFQNNFLLIIENQIQANLKRIQWQRSEISLATFFQSAEFHKAINDLANLLSIKNELPNKPATFEFINFPLLEIKYSQDINQTQVIVRPEDVATLILKVDVQEEPIDPILPGKYLDIVSLVKELFQILVRFDIEKKSPWQLKINHLISNHWTTLNGFTVLVVDESILKILDLVKSNSQNFFQNLLLSKTFLRGIETLLEYSVPKNQQLEFLRNEILSSIIKTIEGLDEIKIDYANSIDNNEPHPELELYSLQSLFEQIGWGNLINVSETIKEITLDIDQFKDSKQFWELFLKQNPEMIQVLKKHPQRNEWIKTLSLKTDQGIKRLSDIFSLETSVDWFNTIAAYGWKMHEKSLWELSLFIKNEHSSNSQWVFIDSIKQLLFEIQTPLTKIQFLQLVLKVYRKIEPNLGLSHIAKFTNLFQELLEFSDNEKEFVRIEHDLPKIDEISHKKEINSLEIFNKTEEFDLKTLEPALFQWVLEHPNITESALESTLNFVWDQHGQNQNSKLKKRFVKEEVVKKWKIELSNFMWTHYVNSREPLNQKSNYFMPIAQTFAHWKSTYQLPYTLQISSIKPLTWLEWLNKVKTPSFLKITTKFSEISDPLNELKSDVIGKSKLKKENIPKTEKKEAPYPSFFNELNWEVLGPNDTTPYYITHLNSAFKEWKSFFSQIDKDIVSESFKEQLFLVTLVSNETRFIEFISSIFNGWEQSENLTLEIQHALKSTIGFIQRELRSVLKSIPSEKETHNELFQTIVALRIYHALFNSNSGLFYQKEWHQSIISRINEESDQTFNRAKELIAEFFKSIEQKISYSLLTESQEWYQKLEQVSALTTAPVSGILTLFEVIFNELSASTSPEKTSFEHPIQEIDQWLHHLRKFNFNQWLIDHWLPKTFIRYTEIQGSTQEIENLDDLEFFENWTLNFLQLFERGPQKYDGSVIEQLIVSVINPQNEEPKDSQSDDLNKFKTDVGEKLKELWKRDVEPLKQTQKLLSDPIQKEILKLKELGENIEIPIKVNFEQKKESVNEQIKTEINRGTRYTANLCGMMLLAPFWGTLFRRLELLEKNEFKSSEHKLLAYQTILAIARIDEESPLELQDLIPRIIVGIPPENELSGLPQLTSEQIEEITKFISAVRSQWPVMINFSNRGFIESFLLRRGTVWKESDSKWMIEVEGYGSDIIMQTLPWGYATMKFPWTSYMIFTEWKAP